MTTQPEWVCPWNVPGCPSEEWHRTHIHFRRWMNLPIPKAFVAPGESVFYACQLAREEMQRAGHVPDWLILGDEEWTRLLEEVSALVPNARAGDVDRLAEFQGMRVARYAVPHHLEVIARAR